MDARVFLNYSIPNRVRLLLTDKNLDYIYILLNKHMKIDMDKLRDMYQLQLNHVKQELQISGNREDIAVLFYYIQLQGLNCLSIEMDRLRIDAVQFINKIR